MTLTPQVLRPDSVAQRIMETVWAVNRLKERFDEASHAARVVPQLPLYTAVNSSSHGSAVLTFRCDGREYTAPLVLDENARDSLRLIASKSCDLIREQARAVLDQAVSQGLLAQSAATRVLADFGATP